MNLLLAPNWPGTYFVIVAPSRENPVCFSALEKSHITLARWMNFIKKISHMLSPAADPVCFLAKSRNLLVCFCLGSFLHETFCTCNAFFLIFAFLNCVSFKILLKGHLVQGAPPDLYAVENSPSHPLISIVSQNARLWRRGWVASVYCFWAAPGPHQTSLRNTKQKFQVTWINNQW